MAAIATTLLFVPAALLLAAGLFLFGSSLMAVATFNGALNGFLALAAWWIGVYLPVLGYSIWVLPWIPPEL